MFQCKPNCDAKCCRIIPIPPQIFKKNRKKIKREYIKDFYLKGHKICLTEDGLCIFLDKDYRCSIYEDRPHICKIYGISNQLPCPYLDINGEIRTAEEVNIVKEKVRKMEKDRLNLLLLYSKSRY